jgi:2'-5' RNA ligase
MRMFVGVWPPASVLKSLLALQESLRRATLPGTLRLTEAEQLHVTLRFLGEVPEDRTPALRAALAEAVAPVAGFPVEFAAFGVFPSPERARVLWVRLTDEAGALLPLQQAVAEAVAPFATQPEERAFHPHVTLARVRNDVRSGARLQLAQALGRIAVPPAEPWPVAAVRLVAGELRPEGALHRTLAEMPLAARR